MLLKACSFELELTRYSIFFRVPLIGQGYYSRLMGWTFDPWSTLPASYRG